MDYREELLNRTMLMLNEAGVEELDEIRSILIRCIGDYEISERCTALAVADGSNVEVLKLFLATKKIEGGSDETAKKRWIILSKFAEQVGKPFASITTFDILKWLAEQQQRVSLSTAECYRNMLASLFRWMHQNRFIPANPMETIRPIKHPEAIKTAFSPVEVDALKSACTTKVDRAMIEILLSTGLRCEELCNLKWKDINFITKDIQVIEGKGNKNRLTMMDDVCKKYLLDYRKSLKNESEYVFSVKYRGEVKQRTTASVWKRLKELGKKAGVTEVNPHKFRHTFATTLYKRGLDVHMIQKLLGQVGVAYPEAYVSSYLF